MDASVFLALALACAPQVHTSTAHALVRSAWWGVHWFANPGTGQKP